MNDLSDNNSKDVEPFYCNHDDGEYHNDPCAEQCNFCKGVESLQ
jgi:hypothetical protein